ncbi:MAG: acetyl/propionyl/methylcrotonyl-CoA carboxylase subunit alpha [Ktedonobacteraceae bacterium]|nr:acetyl/propionyl/methylcrotonyl-CoA carboxylase subunit alpha [Ktedonobacteraceae bacterium]
MFTKILIANRGEIAVRIMATCREMGIRTVAVYSEADSSARHVREADEACCIGPAPAAQSYLNGERIIEAARQCGAEAIHPGYGFLAENADFAEASERAGLVFIGPPAPAMRLMGSKIAARRLAQAVGVPTVPGYDGAEQDDTAMLREAERIGFPLLIKASAGGGGKGMRTVLSAGDFMEQLAGARREALAAFGDATVFLERLIARPRHIEIQVLGDHYGHIIHLGERECSIQRRHQKIVEESPSVALTPAIRAEMSEAAVRLARKAGYMNAGTLEFMLDDDGHFYFLEMNTRLQVEHPVTEFVTGVDLVRHQLLIAAGEPLALSQEQIYQRGHAIEVRLYAEDPARQFLPSTGNVALFHAPAGPGVRVDSGIESGDEISQYYDPMIAKLIVYGEDRPAAVARLRRALQECAVFGVTTNIALLHAISHHPAFEAGQTHTHFLQEHALLEPQTPAEADLPREVAVAAALYETLRETDLLRGTQNGSLPSSSTRANPWQALGPWRMIGEARTLTYTWQEQEYIVRLRPTLANTTAWWVQVNSEQGEEVICMAGQDNLLLLRQGNRQIQVHVWQQNGEIQVACAGSLYHLQRRQPPDIELTAHSGGTLHIQRSLKAPMAGTIVKVRVHEGEEVEAQQVLVILSAMKMEHSITAPSAGKVQRIHYSEGEVVPGGAVLVEME